MEKICRILVPLMFFSSWVVHAQTYFNEDFEKGSGTDLPKGWTQFTKASDGGWLRGYGSDISNYSFSPPIHSYVLATNDSKCE